MQVLASVVFVVMLGLVVVPLALASLLVKKGRARE